MSRVSVELFFLIVAKNFVVEPFCVVFPKISRCENVYGIGGRRFHNFPLIFFCLTVPKHLLGKPPSVSLISCIEKIYAYECYVTLFCRNIFFLKIPKNLLGEPYCVPKNFWYGKKF